MKLDKHKIYLANESTKISLVFAQKIVNIEKNTVLFNAEVKVVSVLKNNFKPCALPQVILEELNGRQ